MGRMTTAQLFAAIANARHRQVWTLYVPQASGSATFDAVTLHDDDSATKRVVDPGSREVYGFNVGRMEVGRFEVGEYTMVLDNTDNLLKPLTTTSLFTNPTTAYQAMPQECDLEHKVYLWVNNAWALLLTYLGRIRDIEYEDSAFLGVATGGLATITSYSKALSDVLDHVWGDADGDDSDTGDTLAY